METQTHNKEATPKHQISLNFLNLPLEIREAIYTALFTSTTVYIGPKRIAPHHCIGLLLSNRQVHEESLALFYRTSTFAIDSESVAQGVAWLALLPARHRDCITRLVFCRSLRYLDMYSMIRYRALEGEGQLRQEVLLEPMRFYLEKWGIVLREGVLTAEFAVW